MGDDRAVLRQSLRNARRDLSPSYRVGAANRLAANLLALPCAPVRGHVAGYWAMDGEIALHTWQLALPEDCVYCLPVLRGDCLQFAPWRPGDGLVSNRYGIPEPDVSPDALLAPHHLSMVVVPLVGFDVTGARLGMGGGWYDRTFASRQQQAAPPWLIGAAFDMQRLDTIETATWDVALDAVCTEATTHHSLARPAASPT